MNDATISSNYVTVLRIMIRILYIKISIMYLVRNTQFFYKNYSGLDAGVEGSVLLNNDFYYSFTLFDTFTAWNKIEELEDQYSNEQLESLEKELLHIYEKSRIPVIRGERDHSLTGNIELPYISSSRRSLP